MPAFPLGSVLLPGELLELRVFEPRYRVLLFDLRDDTPAEFVVNMIERGSEVGGGDVRAPVGCVARIIEQHDLADGTTMLSVLGTDRVRVEEWLAEDPYPLARVKRCDAGYRTPSARRQMDLREAKDLTRSIGQLVERLGGPQPAGPDRWASDPVAATWQLALASPLATIDRYELLATDDDAARLQRLTVMLRELRELLVASTPPPS